MSTTKRKHMTLDNWLAAGALSLIGLVNLATSRAALALAVLYLLWKMH